MNVRTFGTLVVVVSSVVVQCVVGEDSAMAPPISELFSFEKLAQYSSLAGCFALIHEDFAFCNAKAEEKGRAYLEGVDPDSEWARRVKCCGTWKLRDCWVRFARDKCDAKQAEQVARLPYTFMRGLDVSCKDYPDGSPNCRFPLWLILVIVGVGLALVALGVWCGVRCHRRRQRVRRGLAVNGHESQTLKSGSV